MDGKKLRLLTYMSPGIPLSLYQTYQQYLEEVLGCESYLTVESRWSGPPSDRVDPFTADDADIGFICSTSYLKMSEEDQNKYMELLPAAPIHKHPKSELRPVYFSEVVIRKERELTYKEFHDLKGHRWAYNDEESLSGNLCVLAHLKQLGFNSSFFGHIITSGSHVNSLQMVMNGEADVAAIDSSVFQYYLKEHPEHKKEFHVLCSLGPFPIQPVVLNSRMPAEVKTKLKSAFLAMNKSFTWNKELEKHNVWGFKEIDHTLYDKEKEIMEVVKDQSIHTAYY